MNWMAKFFPNKIRINNKKNDKTRIPEGIWDKCRSCLSSLYRPELIKNLWVCPKCEYHFRIGAGERISQFLDKKKYEIIASNIKVFDKLKFKDIKCYKDRLDDAKKKSMEDEAIMIASGYLKGIKVVVSAFNFFFLGGSMGSVVGERFVESINYCLKYNRPLICFTASGGARMQESLYSLLQMVKVSAALSRMKRSSLPYIVVLSDPTAGGVSASLAMLGDIHIAEPGAIICFAGPKVIEQTVKEKLPKNFQTSKFLKEKGMIDMILDRRELRHRIANLLIKMNPTLK